MNCFLEFQMIAHTDITEENYVSIGKAIRDNLYRPAYSFKTTIFLCGADKSKQDTVRAKLYKSFTDRFNSYLYRIVFPEDLFDELLYSTQYGNLLTLENLLADSVDVICIVLESPGAIAELGAFANDERLRSKIICLVEDKFRRDRSFIAKGPLTLLKEEHRDRVIYYEPNNLDKVASRIRSVLSQFTKSHQPLDNITLLQLDSYLLPIIYLFEPVSKEILTKFVSGVIWKNELAVPATTAALTVLAKNRYVGLTSAGYTLTKLGVDQLVTFRNKGSRYKTYEETKLLDNLRLEILNLQYRKKRLTVGDSSL